METPDRESCFKELPTKELKFKRNKDRLNSPTISPIRLRLKSNGSPLSNEADNDKCFSDRSISSSPDSVSHDLSTVFISGSSYIKKCPRLYSPPCSPITCESSNDFYDNAHLIEPPNFDTEEDYDQPLDMSRKRSPDVESQTVLQQQQQRPSVITCASALLKTQCNLLDVSHHMCSSRVSDSSIDDQDDDSCETHVPITSDSNSTETEAARPGHRREIVSGSCDPVIDEHFRRSLGKDYQQIFSKTSANSISVTVDDHFAKALGDTWHQLQQSKSVSSDFVSPHSKSPIQPQQSPKFVHQPPEILS